MCSLSACRRARQRAEGRLLLVAKSCAMYTSVSWATAPFAGIYLLLYWPLPEQREVQKRQMERRTGASPAHHTFFFQP